MPRRRPSRRPGAREGPCGRRARRAVSPPARAHARARCAADRQRPRRCRARHGRRRRAAHRRLAAARGRPRAGASVHSVEDAVEAEAKGADWVVFGPVYDTPSKRPYGVPQGLDALAKVAARVRLPLIAIGGVTPARVAEVRGSGAFGVAAIAAILGAPSPADAVRRFLDALAAA